MTTTRTFKVLVKAIQICRRRPRGWFSLLFNSAMAKLRIAGPLLPPVHLTIEPTNACNLNCPACETGDGSLERKTGVMRYEKFKQLIDQNEKFVSSIMFYFMGEPFLNKESYKMIRYATDRGIYVETCTNGDMVDVEGVLNSNLNEISFQIGGITNETNSIYRIGSSFSRIEDNIKRLVALRSAAGRLTPQINIGLIVMKHNEGEVQKFLKWARELGVDKANIIDPAVKSIEQAIRYLPDNRSYWFYNEEKLKEGLLRPKIQLNNECSWIWNSMTINWDGSVVPCCRDPHGRINLGNVFETALTEIWNGEKMTQFRHRIAKDQRNVSICEQCSGFGVPTLVHDKAEGFEVSRLSVSTGGFGEEGYTTLPFPTKRN